MCSKSTRAQQFLYFFFLQWRGPSICKSSQRDCRTLVLQKQVHRMIQEPKISETHHKYYLIELRLQNAWDMSHLFIYLFFFFLQMFRSPWLYPDFIFYNTADGKRFKKNCQYVHDVAADVMQKRRKELV